MGQDISQQVNFTETRDVAYPVAGYLTKTFNGSVQRITRGDFDNFNPLIGIWKGTENMDAWIDNIAAAMTNVIRMANATESPEYNGVQYVQTVRVQWYWMILPILLTFASILFMILVMIRTARSPVRSWKGSPLTLLLFDVDMNLDDSESRVFDKNKGVQNVVGKRKVRLPSPPSQRTPNRPRHINTADRIEEQIQKCGHDIWGYVIYRTTYESDTDWNELIARLHAESLEVFEENNGKDVLDKFVLTVMGNRELFDGASTGDIRKHFQDWTAQNYTIEQPQTELSKQFAPHAPQRAMGSSRYRYAICIDAEALHATLPSKVFEDEGWVQVVKSGWKPDPAEEPEGGEERLEPLEGVTQHDVGWMRVSLFQYITFYQHGADGAYWDRVYQCPPEIMSP